jgi:hypothetical protein
VRNSGEDPPFRQPASRTASQETPPKQLTGVDFSVSCAGDECHAQALRSPLINADFGHDVQHLARLNAVDLREADPAGHHPIGDGIPLISKARVIELARQPGTSMAAVAWPTA